MIRMGGNNLHLRVVLPDSRSDHQLFDQLDHLYNTLLPNFAQLAFRGRVENSFDPDQLASEKPADLDLHCFQKRIHLCLAW